MLDVSYRSDEPDSVLVYADGADARIIRKLIRILGSQERAQNALILTGYLSKLESDRSASSHYKAKRVKDSFPELVGLPYDLYKQTCEELL